MYEISFAPDGKHSQLALAHVETHETAIFYPFAGGILNVLVLRSKNGKLFHVVEGYQDEEELDTLHYSKSVSLSPFPNRIKDGKYTFADKEYQLPINKANENNAIHGLLQNAKYKLEIHETEEFESADVSFHYDYDGSNSGYPFPFKITRRYKLSDGSLTCKTTVINKGNTAMPFGDGWHPYFKIGEANLEKLQLRLPSQEYLETDPRMIPTGNSLVLNKFENLSPIGKENFDTGFVLDNSEGIAKVSLHSPSDNVTLSLWQETGYRKYNFLQVFIPPFRTCIAFEPMTCAADAFNNKMGLITLEVGESFTASYGVELS
jgi:aldose 1-epimerase